MNGKSVRQMCCTVLIAVVGAGCMPTPQPTGTAGDSAGVTWRTCPDQGSADPSLPEFECATLTVPFDYDHGDGPTFTLPLIRLASTSAQPRLLITNPGGPGIGGVADMRASHEYFAAFTDLYTVVSFDPRGIAGSTPAITCLDERQRSAIFDQPSVPVGDAVLHAEVLARGIGVSCQSRFADSLPHVGTGNVARDIDAIRAALGFEKLTYLGFSYGTFVGALYADMFPQRTDRMVLDSVMDPALTYEQVRHGQAVGMQDSITAFVADCLPLSDCPLAGPPDQALTQILDIVDRLNVAPFRAADGRVLSGARMLALIESSLYFPDSGWPTLREALREAVAGDMAAVTDAAYSDEMMVNPADSAYLAVVCIDFADRRDPAAPQRLAPLWARESPLSGGNRAWSLQPCESWPTAPVRHPGPVRAAGAGPVLILNTTGDPATPLPWAQSLHRQLRGSWLVIAPNQGHIAVSQNACAEDLATKFLRSGEHPESPVYTCPASN